MAMTVGHRHFCVPPGIKKVLLGALFKTFYINRLIISIVAGADEQQTS